MNHAPRLSVRPSCSSSRFRIDGFLPVERRPQIDCLPHFDSLLQLRLLKLNSDALLQLVDLAKWVKTEHGDGAAVGLANPFDALHRGGLSCTVGPDQSEDLPLIDLERRLLDGDGFAVGLADSRDFNDWMHGVFLRSQMY